MLETDGPSKHGPNRLISASVKLVLHCRSCGLLAAARFLDGSLLLPANSTVLPLFGQCGYCNSVLPPLSSGPAGSV